MSIQFFIKSRRKKGKAIIPLKNIMGLSLVLTIFFSAIFINSISNQNQGSQVNDNVDIVIPKISGIDPEFYVCPYTKNISDIRNFFVDNYTSSYSNRLLYRKGDVDGDIIEDIVYSLDNLLFYNTLAEEFSNEIYEEILTSNLWYQKNDTSYGFVRSINGTNGNVLDDTRDLIDNIMPIFLLLDNYNTGSYSDDLEDMYDLMHDSEFWDDTNKGYYTSNSTTTANKEAFDNLYAVLANLMIYKSTEFNPSFKNDAYGYANQTIDKLMQYMWDDNNDGFDVRTNASWGSLSFPHYYKQLDVNALGIMTLLEYWLATNITSYLVNATNLYNKINSALWQANPGAYEYITPTEAWDPPSDDVDRRIDLKANALMMSACLKLFEVTGNISYYDRAYDLFEYFEDSFYDNTNKAYIYIADHPSGPSTQLDNNKNLTSNLYLIEAYLSAREIYNSAQATMIFNVSDTVPDYIFNQDVMNITTHFTYQSLTNLTYISNVTVNYEIISPDNTTFEEIQGTINIGSNNHTLIYEITDNLVIGSNYRVLMWINSTKFCFDKTYLYFNVVSGLENSAMEFKEDVGSILYQGPTYNVTLPINNTRYNNVTLNVSMSGISIYDKNVTNITFITNNYTRVYFNLTTYIGAEVGPDTITFRFLNSSVLFLEVNITIEIGESFDYIYPIYDKYVVSGDFVEVHLSIINFLQNDSQSINVTFSGPKLIDNSVPAQIDLLPDETKPVSFYLNVSGSDSISITMTLDKLGVIYFTEVLSVQMISNPIELVMTYPETVYQWSHANIIFMVQNYLDEPELCTFTIIEQNDPIFGQPYSVIETLDIVKGETRVELLVFSTLNPFEFGVKTYRIEVRDSSGELIEDDIFEVVIELNTTAFFFCYILPILIPVSIVLIYKNKDLKNKQLRR